LDRKDRLLNFSLLIILMISALFYIKFLRPNFAKAESSQRLEETVSWSAKYYNYPISIQPQSAAIPLVETNFTNNNSFAVSGGVFHIISGEKRGLYEISSTLPTVLQEGKNINYLFV